MGVSDPVKAHLALFLVQLLYGVYHTISKVALSDGINQLVFCAYRDVIALAILAPAAYLTERTERISWRQLSGVAKVGGTVVCILGAVFMAIYKGPVVWGDGSAGLHVTGANRDGWISEQIKQGLAGLHISLWQIGILCLIGNCFFMALYLTLQAPLLKIYPAGVSITAYSYFVGAVFIVLSGLVGASDWNDWVLTRSEILAVLFAGIVASAVIYWLLTWSNRVLGPALVALYMPLQPFFSSILARLFLSSSLYLGSVLGGLLIIAGLYCVTWGQMRSRASLGTDDDKDTMGHDLNGEDAPGSVNDPLLKFQTAGVSWS